MVFTGTPSDARGTELGVRPNCDSVTGLTMANWAWTWSLASVPSAEPWSPFSTCCAPICPPPYTHLEATRLRGASCEWGLVSTRELGKP